MFMADTVNDEPIYQQVYHALRALLASAEYPVGSKFLSERQIAERYSVSRPTANKVLASLMAERLLDYRKGVGTFVQEPVLNYELRDLVSFTEKARAAGKTPSTKLISFEQCQAAGVDASICKALQCDADAALFYLERQRLADDEPMIFEQRYIVSEHCSGLTAEEVKASLYAVWTDNYGLQIGGADQRIRAVAADERLAAMLAVKQGEPCFQVQCTGFLMDGRPLWWERTSYRGDNYELISRLGNQDDGQPVHGSLF